jgi:hypothetical protein
VSEVKVCPCDAWVLIRDTAHRLVRVVKVWDGNLERNSKL